MTIYYAHYYQPNSDKMHIETIAASWPEKAIHEALEFEDAHPPLQLYKIKSIKGDVIWKFLEE